MKSIMQARIGTVIFINMWKETDGSFMVEHVNILQSGYKAKAVIGAARVVKRFVKQYSAAHYYTMTVHEVIETFD